MRNKCLQAEFTLQDFSSDFHSLTGFVKMQTKVWNPRQIIHTSVSHTVWIIKDVIWENRRRVADACEIFGLLNISVAIWKWCCVKWVDWKKHQRWPTANEREKYSTAGRSYRSQYQNKEDNNIIVNNNCHFTITLNRNEEETFAWAAAAHYCNTI